MTTDFMALQIFLDALKSFNFKLWHDRHFFPHDQNKKLSKLINILLFAQGKAKSMTKHTSYIEK